jgi:hypothetical protein
MTPSGTLFAWVISFAALLLVSLTLGISYVRKLIQSKGTGVRVIVYIITCFVIMFVCLFVSNMIVGILSTRLP